MSSDKPTPCICCDQDADRPPVEMHLFRKIHHEVTGTSYQGAGMLTAGGTTTTYREEYVPHEVRTVPVCRKCIGGQIWEEISPWVLGAAAVLGYVLFFTATIDALAEYRVLLTCGLIFAILCGMAAAYELFIFSILYFPDKDAFEERTALRIYYPVLAEELGDENVAMPGHLGGIGQICLKTAREARAMRPRTDTPGSTATPYPWRWLLGSLAVQITGVTVAVLSYKGIIDFPLFVRSFEDPKGWMLFFVIVLGLGQVVLVGAMLLLPLFGYIIASDGFSPPRPDKKK